MNKDEKQLNLNKLKEVTGGTLTEISMDKFKRIRPIVVGLIVKNGKVLVDEGFDKEKHETFYRVPGGGIEFLETSEQALAREFKEEINANIKVLEKLDVIEDIFVYDGHEAHEIIFIYKIEIPEEQIQEEYIVIENKVKSITKWINKEDFINGNKIIYPEVVKNIFNINQKTFLLWKISKRKALLFKRRRTVLCP